MSYVPSKAIRRQICALIPVFLNVFMMGCTSGWIITAIHFFKSEKEISATAVEISLITMYNEIGKVIFVLPAGLLTDRYGRRKIILGAGLLHTISWLLLSAHTSVTVICVARFILGIAAALISSTSLISIGEIASPEIRGRMSSLYQSFMCIGVITPFLITTVFSSYYILSYSIAMLSLLCFTSTFWVIETPDYLVNKMNYEEAKNVLKQIRLGYTENDFNTEFEKTKRYIDDERSQKQLNWFAFFQSQSIAKPLATCIVLNFFSMSIGSILMDVHNTSTLPESEFEFFFEKYYSIVTHVLQLVVTICTTFYIDKLPRRSIFAFGAVLMAATNALCVETNFYYTEFNDEIFKWLFAGANLLLIVVYSSSIGPMNNVLISELLPQTVRGLGAALGVMAQAIANVISYHLYNLIAENSEVYNLHIIFTTNSLILCFFVLFVLPESRGKFLSDIQLKFTNGPLFTSTHEKVRKSKKDLC